MRVEEQPSLFPPDSSHHTPQQILILGTLVNRAFRLRLDDFISGLPRDSIVIQLGDEAFTRENRVSEVAQKYGYETRSCPLEERDQVLARTNLVLAFPPKSPQSHIWKTIRQAQHLGVPVRIIKA